MSENDFAVVRALFIGNLCIADVDNWCSTEGFDTNELSFEFNPCIAYISKRLRVYTLHNSKKAVTAD